MKSKHETMSRYFNLPNPGVRSYFDRVVKGNSVEFRTPWYNKAPLSSIVSRWLSYVESLKHAWPSLWEYEIDQSKKIGPMSIMKPLAQRMDDIDSYYSAPKSSQVEHRPIPQTIIDKVCLKLDGLKGLRLKSASETLRNMRLNTNSGTPYFQRRNTVIEKTVPCECYLRDGELQVVQGQHGNRRSWKAAAILGWRGQEGGPDRDDVKQRVVWMFPFAINVLELQFYQPLIAAAQRRSVVPAWIGLDTVDRVVTRLFNTKRPGDPIICTDFSKFDQHFGPNLQEAARSIFSHLLGRDEVGIDWLRRVFPVKYHIPLIYDWGKVRTGPHGMASGSGGTNADETFVHMCLQHALAAKFRHPLNPHSQCLGDDGILCIPSITAEDVVRCYAEYGLEMNVGKQRTSTTDCIYLRRWHHTSYRNSEGVCVGVYSTCRALGRLAEQERWYEPETWSKEMVALRQLSIIENCRYHPLREQFVKFCMEGDQYRLGIDIPGFLERVDVYAKKAIARIPEFLGYTASFDEARKSGLSSWWIVNYLLKLKAKRKMVQ